MNLQHNQTASSANANLELKTARTVANVVYEGPEAIEKRLCELDCEWTAGRVIKATAGFAIVVGLALAMYVHFAWLTLPVVVGLLLLQYTVSRCSLLTWLLRSAGFRTSTEIEHERIALKALRGDFRNLPTVHDKHDEDALARLGDEGGIADAPIPVRQPDVKETAERVLESLKH